MASRSSAATKTYVRIARLGSVLQMLNPRLQDDRQAAREILKEINRLLDRLDRLA